MPIERITADDLRDMEHQEGLVLQGCGGEAREWLDGINDLLTQDGILQNGSRFETVKVFQHDGLTNLLFPFEDIQVDMGKLAMWRLQTHGAFGGTNGAVRRGLRTHARRSIFTDGTHRRIPARTGRNSCAGGNTFVGTA